MVGCVLVFPSMCTAKLPVMPESDVRVASRVFIAAATRK